MTKRTRAQATRLVEALSPEQAYAVGSAVSSLLSDGMPSREIVGTTAAIAKFIKKGMTAQQAVDNIIAAKKIRQHF
jgi:hypothetical protein